MAVSALFYKSVTQESTPRRRGPPVILGIDEAGNMVKFQGQTFEVVRHCFCRQIDPQDVGGVRRTTASGGMDVLDGLTSLALG